MIMEILWLRAHALQRCVLPPVAWYHINMKDEGLASQTTNQPKNQSTAII